MTHPMADYFESEALVRDRKRARCAAVYEALKSTSLGEFTVENLSDLMLLVNAGLMRDHEWSGEADYALTRLEKLVEERGRVLKHGMQVRYKKPKDKSQRGIGVITSRPRKGSRIVHVQGPGGWAGWVHVTDLVIV